MDIGEYRANRAKFSWEELRAYNGQWVGFSTDGSRIIASAQDLLELDRRIRAAGEDPQQIALERIEFDDAIHLGAEEFF